MDALARALAIKAQTRANKAPINILRYNLDGSLKSSPIIPTIPSGFDDQVPTNLSNITDGNPANGAGTGIKAGTGTTIVGYIQLDLGTPQWVDVGGKLGVWTSAGTTGTLNVYVAGSLTTSFVYNQGTVLNTTTSSQQDLFLNKQKVYGRYVSLKIVNSPGTGNPSTTSVIPYELVCESTTA